MKIAIAQINTQIGNFSANLESILKYWKKAQKQGVDLVVFPEMTLTGYPPKDLLDRPDFIAANLRALENLCQKITHPACIVGFVDRAQKGTRKLLYNSAAFLHKKSILAQAHKQLLPTYDVFDEGRYFRSGESSTVFSFLGTKIGLSICEDIWVDPDYYGQGPYEIDPVAEQVKQGADILINISASPFARGKIAKRARLLGKQVKSYQRPLIYVNLVGGNDDLVFDGSSLVFTAHGHIVQKLKSFAEDMSVVATQSLSQKPNTSHALRFSQKQELENCLDALVLGLRDYMQKCGFQKAVLGLSGGIDSALTAWIACAALGSKNVLGVSMPSPYSSSGSVADAEKLARALKMQYRSYPIANLYQAYQNLMSFESSNKVGLSLQNIQARIRGNILMALSNEEGRLLLATGNKSELSIGYCTLYGDMAGGFAVLADVPKTMVYQLSRVANRRIKAIPESTFRKAPSAELAPDQLDTDDLPPYPVLDAILAAYVEEHLDPEEIVQRGYDPKLVQDILARLDKNEYKRSQMPPGLRISSKAFGYGRRMPLSSRYRWLSPSSRSSSQNSSKTKSKV